MKNNQLHTKRESGFKVPENYFSGLDQQILDAVKLKEKASSHGFKIPKAYFETFDERLISELSEQKETKVISLLSWKKTLSIAAVAACLIFMFNLFLKPSETLDFESLELTSIESYLEDSDYSSYELATVLFDENLLKDNFIDNAIEKEQLEDYLLETTDLEDLIIE